MSKLTSSIWTHRKSRQCQGCCNAFDPRRSNISKIEKEIGVKFVYVSARQPADVSKSAGVEAAETITQVSDSVIPAFKSAAEEIFNTSGLSVVELLAKALAKASGYTEIKSRSLLITLENHVTVLLEAGKPICTPSFAYGALRRFLPEDKVESIKSLALTADGNGAVFDVATENSWMQLDRGGQHSSIVLHGRFIMLGTSLLCGYLYPGPTSACFQFAWPHLACNLWATCHLPFLHPRL